jgi:hypothetical protein
MMPVLPILPILPILAVLARTAALSPCAKTRAASRNIGMATARRRRKWCPATRIWSVLLVGYRRLARLRIGSLSALLLLTRLGGPDCRGRRLGRRMRPAIRAVGIAFGARFVGLWRYS